MDRGAIDQGQLDQLFTASLEAAMARIEKDGHFFPLVFELRANGVIHNLAVLELAPINTNAGVLDRLAELLKSRADVGKIKAAAIVINRAEDQSFMVHVRAPNYSKDVAIPFEITYKGMIRRRRRVSLGEFAASEAPNAIF